MPECLNLTAARRKWQSPRLQRTPNAYPGSVATKKPTGGVKNTEA